jgi:hypothetical protein
MGRSPIDPPPKRADSKAARSLQAGPIAQTARFATSQIAALTTFFGAVAGSAYAYRKLPTALGISPLECAALVGSLLALFFFAHTLPTLRERWREARLAQIKGRLKPGYFLLGPREDEGTFKRADGKHDEVLKWLRQLPRRVLYLTGSSGAGKSSLLGAWVQPKLEREGVKVIRLRGYQDPAQALEDELKRPGAIFEVNPPETTNLSELFEEACQRVKPARMLLVLEQFEEFLILQEEQQRARFLEFLVTQASLKDAGASILLVFRSEYDGFIQDLNLPTPIPGQNLQKVSAFTQRAARDFLLGSGLKFDEQLLADVLREAAEVEETKGLIRPVTLNLCGLVLARFPSGLPHSFRPGRLVRGFVHEAVFQKDVREASPVLLPKLISPQVTKQPCAIEELAKDTGLSSRQAQGVMFKLSDPEYGIVRALNPEQTIWEIAHDFLVPMIDSILAQWRVLAWRRVRPWLPLAYVAVLLAVLFLAPRLFPDPIAELSRLGWETRHVDASSIVDEGLAKEGIKYVFQFNSIPPPEAMRALKRVPRPFVLKLYNISAFDSARFGDLGGLANLRGLDLDGNSEVSDFSALKGLPESLAWLSLSDDPKFRDSWLKDLPRSLTHLQLGEDREITNAGLEDLPRSLNYLGIGFNRQITDDGLKNLPKSLTYLDLQSDYGITEAGLKSLPAAIHVIRPND